MIDEIISQMRTHRNSIQRYRRLLSTKLTDQERSFIERRIAEEQALVESLVAANFPVNLGATADTLGF
jgi:hypothetical protein